MLDLAHLLHVLSFALGIAAMLVVYNNRRIIPGQYLWSYIIVLLCINLVSAAHSYESFVKIKASLGASNIDLFLHLGIMTVFLGLVRITLAYHFTRFCWLLTGLAWKPIYRSLYIILLWAIPGTQAMAIIFPGYLSVSWLPAGMVVCHLLVFIAFLAGSFRVLVFTWRSEQEHRTRWLYAFFWFWTAFNLLIFFNRIAGYAYLVSLNKQLLFFGIITLTMNALHIFFANRFFREYQVFKADKDIGRLMQEYGISKREQDIVRLICEGKTNKEIAAALFITANTVRDHTSNIYRKTGVKNRTQLAGLFN